MRTARERCWRYDWVLDLDLKGFFDSIDWELMLRAIRHHTDCPWVLLYIERWSPLLANLFLHYAFDAWMARKSAHILFERYADDIRRHHLSLQKRRGGASTLGRNCRPLGGLQAGAASR